MSVILRTLRCDGPGLGEYMAKLIDLSAMARKIHWDKVLAALNTTCTRCGRVIRPNEIMRLNFKEMICPACGAIFDPLEKGKSDQ